MPPPPTRSSLASARHSFPSARTHSATSSPRMTTKPSRRSSIELRRHAPKSRFPSILSQPIALYALTRTSPPLAAGHPILASHEESAFRAYRRRRKKNTVTTPKITHSCICTTASYLSRPTYLVLQPISHLMHHLSLLHSIPIPKHFSFAFLLYIIGYPRLAFLPLGPGRSSLFMTSPAWFLYDFYAHFYSKTRRI